MATWLVGSDDAAVEMFETRNKADRYWARSKGKYTKQAQSFWSEQSKLPDAAKVARAEYQGREYGYFSEAVHPSYQAGNYYFRHFVDVVLKPEREREFVHARVFDLVLDAILIFTNFAMAILERELLARRWPSHLETAIASAQMSHELVRCSSSLWSEVRANRRLGDWHHAYFVQACPDLP